MVPAHVQRGVGAEREIERESFLLVLIGKACGNVSVYSEIGMIIV